MRRRRCSPLGVALQRVLWTPRSDPVGGVTTGRRERARHGTLHINLFTTLDGVAQAPGGPEEDPAMIFAFYVWQAPLFDDMVGRTGRIRDGGDGRTASWAPDLRHLCRVLAATRGRYGAAVQPHPEIRGLARDTNPRMGRIHSSVMMWRLRLGPRSPSGSSIGSRSGCIQSSSVVGRRSSSMAWFRRTYNSSSRWSPRHEGRSDAALRFG